MYEAYVIGTSPNNILYLVRDGWKKVRGVYGGVKELMSECIIWSHLEAEDILEDLKTNCDKIRVGCHASGCCIIVENTDPIDPNDLHIYQLGAVKEIL